MFSIEKTPVIPYIILIQDETVSAEKSPASPTIYWSLLHKWISTYPAIL